MRVLLFLASFIVSVAAVAFAYLEQVRFVHETFYVVIITLAVMFLSFVSGHFAYSAWQSRKTRLRTIAEASQQEEALLRLEAENKAHVERIAYLEAECQSMQNKNLAPDFSETLYLYPNDDKTLILPTSDEKSPQE